MIKFFRDKKNRYFLRVWWAQLISQFGDRLHQMALIGLIAERAPGSVMGLAKILAFTIIPVFIVGPIAGALIDRWDHRRTLVVCDIIRGILVLLIPMIFMAWRTMVPIYIIVFLVFCCSRFYVPAKMSIIPDLVPRENLLMANSLITTTGMIAFVLGCALGGFWVDKWGAWGGFMGDAATFFISAALIISIGRDFRIKIDHRRILKSGREILDIERSIFKEIREGLQYLIDRREIRFVITMLFILLSAAGAVYVVIIVFIQEIFHSVTRDLGVLAVALGLGLFCGALAYGRWGKKMAWEKTIFVCLTAGGIMMIIFTSAVARSPHIGWAILLAALMGLVIGPIFIASNTIVQVVSDEKMRGKVFSALEIVIHLAFLASMLASSFLSKMIDERWILVGVGSLFTGVGAWGLVWLKKRGPLVTLP